MTTDKLASAIKNSAIRILSRRDHSQWELEQQLLKRYPDESARIALAIEAMQSYGYQSDARFATVFVRSRAARGYGPIRIQQDLRQRQVNDALIAEAFRVFESSWIDLATQVLSKKYSQPAQDFKETQKQKRFLFYRGFDSDQINSAYEAFAETFADSFVEPD